ncbi:MAG TPA: ankyrin repeat domain-containing protein [Melioribacteraceae bacterium]|nr:ankyrin repeat domain-containing protein [Melioribacteraceae bacterium]
MKKIILIGSLIMAMTMAVHPQDIFDAVIMNDSVAIENILASKPFSINQKNNMGLTPLAYSVLVRNNRAAEILLKKGALVNTGENNLRFPVHYANWNSDTELFELLLKYGAIIDTRAIGGATPLIHSSLNNNFEMSKFLIEKGAVINIQCNALTSPLYFATFNNNLAYMEYLIKAGTEIDMPDFLYRTPLYIAVRDGYKKSAELLLSNGADISWRDNFKKRSLLHLAAIEGHAEIVSMLIEKGMNVNEKDESGFTPIDYAYKYGNMNTVQLLQSKGGKTNKISAASSVDKLFSMEYQNGCAELVKLQNGSWGIITNSSFFILGYSEIGFEADDKSILNGYISDDLFKYNKKIYSIDHSYHPQIARYSFEASNPLYSFQKAGKEISFIFNLRNDRKYEVLDIKNVFFPKPNNTVNVNGAVVTSLSSFGGNMCYIIEVDGLTIVWLTGICDNYQTAKKDNQIIKELVSRKIQPDILLLGSPEGLGPEIAHGIRETYIEAANLEPLAVVAFGHEGLERKIKYQLQRKKVGTDNFICAEYPGDRFKIGIK